MRIAVARKERQLVEKTEVAEQAARLKGEFLANMSHEVRTPINGVLGMTELLLNTSLDDTQRRYAKTISRSGNSLLAVINDILDFSKIEAGKLDLAELPFDLRDLVEDVTEIVADLAQKKGVEVALIMPPESPVAFKGDAARIRQVLTNLLSNAAKFTSQGEVRLEVSVVETEQSRSEINFAVVDTGIGIAPEHLEKIFDSFVQADGSTTRQFGGTGLGLSISNSLVELMGGKLQVHSTLGEGATFHFNLPLEQLPNRVAHEWRRPDALVGKRILIVDDNATNREILSSQMTYWGAFPVATTGAEQALRQLEESAEKGQPFDAGILDMHMPRTNGIELARTIHARSLAPSTVFMLLSSACDSIDLQECRDLGVHSLVHKPVRQPDLYHCLSASLDPLVTPTFSKKHVVKQIQENTVRGHVLLAEDNPVNQDMMLEMLRLLGLTAELASNGQEAVDATAKGTYDAVIMDCQMPVMDGFVATQTIRDREAENADGTRLPIIALTANAMQGDREQCIANGMDDYLSKPVSSAQLREMLSKWLRNDTPTDAANDTVAVEQETSADYPTRPIIDEAVYNEVRTMCDQAPDGFYERLVDTYEQGAQEDLNLLASGIRDGDSQLVGARAHRLKSSSASWGASHLAKLCLALESAGKNDSLDNAQALLDQVSDETAQVVALLKSRTSRAA